MGAYFFNHVWEMLYKPWIHLLEVIVIGAIAYHALNGIRIILFDLGIGVGKGTQKVIFWALVPVWLLIFAFFFYSFFWRVS
jgi:succinate dehydrogenase / fumarate reductase cytochrome b subunit